MNKINFCLAGKEHNISFVYLVDEAYWDKHNSLNPSLDSEIENEFVEIIEGNAWDAYKLCDGLYKVTGPATEKEILNLLLAKNKYNFTYSIANKYGMVDGPKLATGRITKELKDYIASKEIVDKLTQGVLDRKINKFGFFIDWDNGSRDSIPSLSLIIARNSKEIDYSQIYNHNLSFNDIDEISELLEDVSYIEETMECVYEIRVENIGEFNELIQELEEHEIFLNLKAQKEHLIDLLDSDGKLYSEVISGLIKNIKDSEDAALIRQAEEDNRRRAQNLFDAELVANWGNGSNELGDRVNGQFDHYNQRKRNGLKANKLSNRVVTNLDGETKSEIKKTKTINRGKSRGVDQL